MSSSENTSTEKKAVLVQINFYKRRREQLLAKLKIYQLQNKVGLQKQFLVVTQWIDNHIHIPHAEEYYRPDYNEMLSLAYSLMSKYQVDKVYIDGANPSFIRSLKLHIGEDCDYHKVIARYRSEKMSGNWSQDMRIVPVNFNAEHKVMLNTAKCYRKMTVAR
jgi:hypothetical protein